MALTEATQTEARRDELLELAEAWASMTKDLSIYPETNQRIRQGLEGFLTRLRDVLGSTSQLEITIHLEKVRVGVDEIPFPAHSNLPWLRTRLDPYGYAGLAFSKDLKLEDLLRYTQDLARPRLGKELMDPPEVPGIKPILRVFGAAIHGREIDPAHFMEHPLIAEVCEASDEIRRKVEFLQRSILELQGDERIDITPETLISILPYLPDSREELDSPTLSGKELSLLLARLQKDDLLPSGEHSSWSSLLNKIGRNLFGTETKQEEKPEVLTGAARGHANDDKIWEDLTCFLEEFESLPEGEVKLLGRQEPGFEEELLASYLELLFNDRDPAHREKLGHHLTPLVSRPEPQFRHVVQRCLDPNLSPLWRIGELVDWLRENGQLSLVKSCGAFDPKETVARFPVGFLTFMDTFDRQSETDAADFARICSEIGPTKILEASKLLILTGGLEAHGRKELLFQGKYESFLPLIHILLQQSGTKERDRVIKYLRHLGIQCKEACLLQLLRRNEDIPQQYILDLTARDDSGRFPPGIRTTIVHVLRDLLASEDHGRFDLATRTYAIRIIGEFRAREAKGILDELARQKTFLGFGNKAKKVLAKAARQAMKLLEE
mgnify:CR=1 FL=1